MTTPEVFALRAAECRDRIDEALTALLVAGGGRCRVAHRSALDEAALALEASPAVDRARAEGWQVTLRRTLRGVELRVARA